LLTTSSPMVWSDQSVKLNHKLVSGSIYMIMWWTPRMGWVRGKLREKKKQWARCSWACKLSWGQKEWGGRMDAEQRSNL
jgi:hypothetical protein